MAEDAPQALRRRQDDGFLCWLALRAGQFWDFIDKRDIDKHVLSLAILYGSVHVTRWAMNFAEIAAKVPGAAQPAAMAYEGVAVSSSSGFEAAAIIAAVLAPYMALQAAALKYYFETRSS